MPLITTMMIVVFVPPPLISEWFLTLRLLRPPDCNLALQTPPQATLSSGHARCCDSCPRASLEVLHHFAFEQEFRVQEELTLRDCKTWLLVRRHQ
ncbi:hypothetical protein C8J55DRAFT_517373 [Lentinula edodes]|uniref:Secreted protein n=1 Tax=Lentinula lateritia TaxID=40482 RepID=A0A9W9DLD1_9AGAR|nr:hypothetical protein C8J55DRAFT_517373 [Lentinula edodes]